MVLGMGLVVSKGLVQSMSGDLWLEKTTLGKGSEFRVRIPLRPVSNESATSEQTNTSFVDQTPKDINIDSRTISVPGAMEIDDKEIISNDSSRGNDSTTVTDETDSCRTKTQFASPSSSSVKRVQTVADLRVLVVEDNFVVRKLIIRMLGRLGMVNIVECENGLVAVQQCQKEHYDLVLMDCGMPV
jgi:CheY-like chemotaxis protein